MLSVQVCTYFSRISCMFSSNKVSEKFEIIRPTMICIIIIPIIFISEIVHIFKKVLERSPYHSSHSQTPVRKLRGCNSSADFCDSGSPLQTYTKRENVMKVMYCTLCTFNTFVKCVCKHWKWWSVWLRPIQYNLYNYNSNGHVYCSNLSASFICVSSRTCLCSS